MSLRLPEKIIFDYLKVEIKSIVKKLPKFTVELLTEMEKDGIIQFPLSKSDSIFLSQLHQIWGKEKFARFFLQKIKKDRRKLLLIKPLSKVEGYIFSRYYNAKTKLKISDVINEVHFYYKVPITKNLIKKVKKIRNRAQIARWRGLKGCPKEIES